MRLRARRRRSGRPRSRRAGRRSRSASVAARVAVARSAGCRYKRLPSLVGARGLGRRSHRSAVPLRSGAMNFHSLDYLLFLAVILAGYWLLARRRILRLLLVV